MLIPYDLVSVRSIKLIYSYSCKSRCKINGRHARPDHRQQAATPTRPRNVARLPPACVNGPGQTSRGCRDSHLITRQKQKTPEREPLPTATWRFSLPAEHGNTHVSDTTRMARVRERRCVPTFVEWTGWSLTSVHMTAKGLSGVPN